MSRTIVLLMLILVIALPAGPNVAQAQNDVPPGADIVFVVDQSGSMTKGTIYNSNDRRCAPVRQPDCPRTPPTDPDGMAVKAVGDGLSPIFERMVLRSLVRDPSPGVSEEYRFGLVLFGGANEPEESVVTAVPLTRIEIERAGDGTLHSNIARMLPTTVRNLGETAFSRAFAGVCGVLSCATPTPPNRKRIVVLLTDGQPSLDTIPFDGTNPAPYFEALRREHTDLLRNTELWVLGLDRNDQFWSKNVPYWNQMAPGRTYRLTDPKDIAERFRAIARTIVGDPPGDAIDCDGTPFKIDPYRTSLTLIVEYAQPGNKATITTPDGAALRRSTGGVLGYTTSAQSETFVIAKPQPGAWRCAVPSASITPRLRVNPGRFSLASARIAPPPGTPLSPCRDFGLNVSYLDAEGSPVAELPEYPFNQALTVTIDGQPIGRRLEPANAARDSWAVENELTPGPRGGTYLAQVQVRLPNGTELLSATQQIAVDPRLPCIRPAAPADGSVSQMYESLALTDLEVAVVLTQGGQPADITGVFREDPAHIVSGRLEGPGGISQTLALQPMPGQPGIFAARVSDLQEPGAYRFAANLKATTREGLPYELASQTIAFSRIPDPYWVGVRWGMRIAVVVALMALLLLAGYTVFMSIGPYPRGTLVLERRTTGALADLREWEQVTSIALSGQRWFCGLLRTRRPVVKRRALKDLGLNASKVRRVSNAKGNGVQVTLVRDQKRPPLSFEFYADKEYKTFDAKYRITYENYGARRKSLTTVSFGEREG
jgi:hypothetical protein